MVDILYWHTRSSTVGISKFATILFAVVTLGEYFLESLSAYKLNEHLLITLFATIANLPFELSPFLMLKVIWRMEFGWNQKKGKGEWTDKEKKMKRRRCEVPVPSVNFAKASHAERASDRLDARTPWTLKLSVSVLRNSQFMSYSRDIFYSSSLYHPALPISSSHPQLPSFSLHLSAYFVVNSMNTPSSPSLRGHSLLQGSL